MLLFAFMTVIHGHHVQYKAIWTPYTGQLLLVQKEPPNTRDERAVVIVTTEQTVVGHVPQVIAEIQCYFLCHGANITCVVDATLKMVLPVTPNCYFLPHWNWFLPQTTPKWY